MFVTWVQHMNRTYFSPTIEIRKNEDGIRMCLQKRPLWRIKGAHYGGSRGHTMVDQGDTTLWWIKGTHLWWIKGAHYGGSRGHTMVDQGGTLWWIKGTHYGWIKGTRYGGSRRGNDTRPATPSPTPLHEVHGYILFQLNIDFYYLEIFVFKGEHR